MVVARAMKGLTDSVPMSPFRTSFQWNFTIRAKKRKLQAEMDEKYYEQRMMLREISEQYATQRAIAAQKRHYAYCS